MSTVEDVTTHRGCERERGADGVHRAQFCIFCLRKIGDDAQLRVAELEAAAKGVHEAWVNADTVSDLGEVLAEPMNRLEHVLAFGASPTGGEVT